MWVDNLNTKVILIGVDSYTFRSYPDIPNVSMNIRQIKNLLAESDLFGIPQENIREYGKEDAAEIYQGINDFITQNDQLAHRLFIYYSGHGDLGYNEENKQVLYLTTANSKKNNLEYTAIPIEKLKSVIRKSRATKKILILDCCYSGKALESGTLAGDKSSIIEKELHYDETGAYIMTSTDQTTTARFDEKNPETPTYFTKFLLDIVRNGIEGIGKYCTMDDIYNALLNQLTHSDLNLPEPKCNSRENGYNIRFVLNKKYVEPELSPKEAWKQAKSLNTVKSFEDFMKAYPDSDFIEDAQEKIMELNVLFDWRKTYSSRTPDEYKKFLERNQAFFDTHPEHYLIIEANKRITETEEQIAHPKKATIWQNETQAKRNETNESPIHPEIKSDRNE